MYTLHCTRKLLERIKQPVAPSGPEPTTRLGNWYATAVFWKPQVVLAVNEQTLLPVIVPLAPAATVTRRFPAALQVVLRRIGIPEPLIDDELAAMNQVVTAKTANRSVLGIINEFTVLAEHAVAEGHDRDHLELALWLADTPCSPLRHSTGFPSDETRLLLTGQPPGPGTPPRSLISRVVT